VYIMPISREELLQNLMCDVENFVEQNNRVPTRRYKITDSSELKEHSLAQRVNQLILGETFQGLTSDDDIAKLQKIGITLKPKRETSINHDMYLSLVTELIAFVEKHNRVPNTKFSSTTYEKRLYAKWQKLDSRKIYVKYYNTEDKNKLIKLGYIPALYKRYLKLKAELFDFVRTYNRFPESKFKYKEMPEFKYEYKLGRSLYLVKNGMLFRSFLNEKEIKEFAEMGIEIYTYLI
jgi:hypothetical protein